MAKQSNKLNIGPWTLKNKQINDFIRVTEINRKHVAIQGRLMYIIEGTGNPYTYCGTLVIDPCFTKGWWMYPFLPFNKPASGETHYKHYQAKEKDFSEHVKTYRSMIDKFVAKGSLYIKQEDPILTYYKI